MREEMRDRKLTVEAPGSGGMDWTAILGLLAVVAVSIGIWGAAIKAGIALLR